MLHPRYNEKNSTIILDPINKILLKAIQNNQKDFIGGNCTVSLMLMAIGGLFKAILSIGFFNDLPSSIWSRSKI